jgi:hypothetical protein
MLLYIFLMAEHTNVDSEGFSMTKFLSSLYDSGHDIFDIEKQMIDKWFETCGKFNFPEAFDNFIDFRVCKFCDSKNRAEYRFPIFTRDINNYGVIVCCNESSICHNNALSAARRIMLGGEEKKIIKEKMFVKRTNGNIEDGWETSSWYYGRENNHLYIICEKDEQERSSRIITLASIEMNSKEQIFTLLKDIARQFDRYI